MNNSEESMPELDQPHTAACTPDIAEARFYAEFGQRLKAVRTSRRITQSDLSEAVGLSRPTIANIERGRQRVHLAPLLRIARFLKISSNELLGLAEVGVHDDDAHRSVEFREEFREVILDSDGAVSSWRRARDIAELISWLAQHAEYEPVGRVRTVATIYGPWRQLSVAPSGNPESQR